jgi:hypothetical protein
MPARRDNGGVMLDTLARRLGLGQHRFEVAFPCRWIVANANLARMSAAFTRFK